jgi:hypothetical protein
MVSQEQKGKNEGIIPSSALTPNLWACCLSSAQAVVRGFWLERRCEIWGSGVVYGSFGQEGVPAERVWVDEAHRTYPRSSSTSFSWISYFSTTVPLDISTPRYQCPRYQFDLRLYVFVPAQSAARIQARPPDSFACQIDLTNPFSFVTMPYNSFRLPICHSKFVLKPGFESLCWYPSGRHFTPSQSQNSASVETISNSVKGRAFLLSVSVASNVIGGKSPCGSGKVHLSIKSPWSQPTDVFGKAESLVFSSEHIQTESKALR